MPLDLGFPKQKGLRLWQDRYRKYLRMPLRRMLHPRRFHAFCIGTSKSGTHSITHMLEHAYSARHEPKERETIRFSLRQARGEILPEDQRAYIRQRDRHMWLEMDASNLNIELVPLLAEVLPDAKFILTVRECVSWVDSEINHFLSHPYPPQWKEMWNHRYRANRFTHAPEERILAENGLYTLDGYLSYWAWHQSIALDTIPADRLLVIPMKQLSHSTEKIADFLGIPHAKMSTDRAHSFEAANKFGIVAQLDPAFVRAKAREHCQKVMDRLFPDSAELRDPGP